jgi:O-antigen/teichoic acid export membrane protein
VSRLARQAIVLSAARIANYGLMLLSPILLVRILAVEDFGRYREFLVYTTLLAGFAGFGIYDTLLYFIPAHAASRWRIIRQTTLLVLYTSTAVLGLVVALDLLLDGALIGSFLFPMVVYVLLFVNVDFWEWYWLADNRPAPMFIYTTTRMLVRMAIVLVAAATTHSVTVIVYGLIALEAVRLTGSYLFWRSARSNSEPLPATNTWHEQLRFCMPWGVAGILGYASRNLGNIVVVKLLGAVSLAHYTIGLYGEPIIVAVRNSISAVLLPEMVRRGTSSGEEALVVWRRATIVNCTILFPVGVLLVRYAEPIVVTAFGAAYRAAIPVLQIYALVIVRECFDVSLPLRSASRTMPLVQSSLVSLAVSSASLFLLLPAAGIVGATAALVAAGFAEAAFLVWQVVKFYRVSVADLLPWGSALKVGGAAVLASVVTLGNFWTQVLGFAGIVFAGTLYIVVFALLVWLLRVPEIEVLRVLARRVLSRVQSLG